MLGGEKTKELVTIIKRDRARESCFTMMYPYVTLDDDTEITHSEMRPDGRVKVFIETPDERDGFHSAVCWLPEHRWEDVRGYSPIEMDYFRQFVRNNAHCVIEFSKDGGVLNAADS